MDELTARRAESRRRIHEPVLRELHAAGLTDPDIARAIGAVSACGVRRARAALGLPPNLAAVRRAAAESGREGARRRAANAGARAAELALPVERLTPLAARAVELLAAGPRTLAQLAASLGCSGARDAGLATHLRRLRRAGVARSRSVYGGPTFRRPSVWSLSPDLFTRDALSPLQRKLAAQPKSLSLARGYAARYAARAPHAADDIESAALLGLADAARLYDPSRWQFTTYAARRVAGEIRDTLRATGLKGYRRDYGGSGKVPRAVTGASGAEFDLLAESAAGLLPVGWEAEAMDALEALTACLPTQERAVLRLYFGHARTQQQIAAALGLSESRVSQLKVAGLARLREKMGVEMEVGQRVAVSTSYGFRGESAPLDVTGAVAAVVEKPWGTDLEIALDEPAFLGCPDHPEPVSRLSVSRGSPNVRKLEVQP